jgi:hypothetical protein
VAEAVVDDLEVVEVDEENRDARLVAAQAGKGKLQTVQEERPVWKVGQGIVKDPVGKTVLSGFSLLRRPGRVSIMGALGAICEDRAGRP